jgi:hypothetical protein
LLTKASSRYAIVCSMKNVMTILWNCHVELSCDNSFRIIVFKLLTLSGLGQWSELPTRYFCSPSLVHGWGWVVQRYRGINTRWCVR